MMVQWGCYFCFSWFITWRLILSNEDAKELEMVDEILSFSTLYQSMVSSIISLSFAQLRSRYICFQLRNSARQKVIYMVSSTMNTVCNFLILVSWQTAIVDFGIGMDIYEESGFGFFDLEILIIAFLLVTPFLYKHMVLPTSSCDFTIITMDCQNLYNEMMNQCFVISFYLGLTAFINSFIYGWGPELKPSLGEMAANITGNEEFESL